MVAPWTKKEMPVKLFGCFVSPPSFLLAHFIGSFPSSRATPMDRATAVIVAGELLNVSCRLRQAAFVFGL